MNLQFSRRHFLRGIMGIGGALLVAEPLRLSAQPVSVSQGTVNYLLDDEFTVDAIAPLDSLRTCVPGPGSLNLVQRAGNFSITSETLQFEPVDPPNWGDFGLIDTTARQRIAGLTALSHRSLTSDENGRTHLLGWTTGTTLPVGNSASAITSAIYRDNHQQLYVNESAQLLYVGRNLFDNLNYQFAVVLRNEGAFCFIKGGLAVNWTLLWVINTGSEPEVYTFLDSYRQGGRSDYLRITQLPAPFDTDYGIAGLNIPVPENLTQYIGFPDQILDLDIIAPSTLAEEGGIRYRILDDENYWHAYFNAEGAFVVEIVRGGIVLNHLNIPGVIEAGQRRTIRIVSEGGLHDFYTSNSTVWTKQGTPTEINSQNEQAALAVSLGAGWSVENLRVYPLTSTNYDLLDSL
jgi:hypothetical protein